MSLRTLCGCQVLSLLLVASIAASDQTPAKPNYAVLDFDSELNRSHGAQIADLLVSELSRQDPTCTLLERQKLATLLEERKLQNEISFESQESREAACLLPADYVLTGRFYKTEKTSWISVKILNTKNSTVESVLSQSSADTAMTMQVKRLTEQLLDKIQKTRDPSTAIIRKCRVLLANKQLPTVALSVDLRENPDSLPGSIIQTELAYVLKRIGFRLTVAAKDNNTMLLAAGIQKSPRRLTLTVLSHDGTPQASAEIAVDSSANATRDDLQHVIDALLEILLTNWFKTPR